MASLPFDIHPDPSSDRVLVVASPPRALDLLRLAVLRSDDVILVAESVSAASQRFALHFAVDVAQRSFAARDLDGTAAVLVSLDRPEDENRIVREARRHRVPIHVMDRPLVSDFSALALLERSRGARAAA